MRVGGGPGPRPAIRPAGTGGAGARPGPGRAGRGQPGGRGRNRLATAALACAVLGAALLTIPAGLILGVLGLRRSRAAGHGAVRCWVAIGLCLAWAGAAAYLLPHLARAADPGCMTYKNSALSAYNRVVADVHDGSRPADLERDLAATIRQLDTAARHSHSPPAARSLRTLSGGLRTVLRDVRAKVPVPRPVLLRLNPETGRADAACGTVHL